MAERDPQFCQTCGGLIKKNKWNTWTTYSKTKYCSKKCADMRHKKKEKRMIELMIIYSIFYFLTLSILFVYPDLADEAIAKVLRIVSPNRYSAQRCPTRWCMNNTIDLNCESTDNMTCILG